MNALIQCFLAFVGAAAGAVTAAGVFALITVIGIIPRMAGKTGTAKWISVYEWAVVLGGIFGNLVDLFHIPKGGGTVLLLLFGLGSGTFVSCLIMSLAEVMDVFPVMCRRIRLQTGIAFLVLSLALGKMAGALLFFWNQWGMD